MSKMDEDKKLRLISKGFVFGTVKEFLNLTDEEMEIIEKRMEDERKKTAKDGE